MSIASEVSYSESSTFWPLPVRWRALSAARMELLASIPVHDVDDRDAVLGRAAVGLAADAHQPGLGLQDEVVAGQRRLRSGRAVAGDGAAHEARRMLLEPGVGEAPLLQRAEPEIVDQHVGLLDQAGEDLLPGRHRHVERERALVAIDAEEIRAPRRR